MDWEIADLIRILDEATRHTLAVPARVPTRVPRVGRMGRAQREKCDVYAQKAICHLRRADAHERRHAPDEANAHYARARSYARRAVCVRCARGTRFGAATTPIGNWTIYYADSYDTLGAETNSGDMMLRAINKGTQAALKENHTVTLPFATPAYAELDDPPTRITSVILPTAVTIEAGIVGMCIRKANEIVAEVRAFIAVEPEDAKTATEEARYTLASAIAATYSPGYGPPSWAVETYTREYDKYAQKAALFYDAGADEEAVRLVATQREPSNVAMKPHFDAKKLENVTGEPWTGSGYTQFYKDHGKLAPNIGVLTLAPSAVARSRNGGLHAKPGRLRDIYIYHAIGAALDNENQADYKAMVANKEPDETRRLLLDFYVSVFTKIFEAARSVSATGIVMSLVGAVSFAGMYPGPAGTSNEVAFHSEVWIPAYAHVRAQYTGFKMYVTGDLEKIGDRPPNPAGIYLLANKHTRVALFPELMNQVPAGTMIVNAWDPHTLPGNGNEGDDTIDGWIGRYSAIHFFGWAYTNPQLLENMHPVRVVPYSE